MRRIVIAVDGLTAAQQERICEAVVGWGEILRVPENVEDWSSILDSAEVVFGWPAPSAVESSGVQFLQVPSSGCSQYLTEGLTGRPDFRLASARGVTAGAVAEHGLALMFALARRLPMHIGHQIRHEWERAASYDLLSGSTVLIVGLGAIGSALGERCGALGMKVLAARRSSGDPPSFLSQVFALDELHTALGCARHVVLTLASEPGAVPLFGAAEFSAMPPGSYFYNLARGSLVDEDALEAALTSGHLAGAGLDVFCAEPLDREHSLWNAPNLVITPHAGGRFSGELDGLVDLFLANLHRYHARQALKNTVIDNHLSSALRLFGHDRAKA